MDLSALLARALEPRMPLFDTKHEAALRLFNGFVEGAPELLVDCYARTLVITSYADPPSQGAAAVELALAFYRERLPWLQAGLLKRRAAPDAALRNGELLFGEALDRRIREHGVAYAIDLTLNRDAGFYLDTRELRRWLRQHMAGLSVLNAFAYTGSLGVAARAGGARSVLHLDLSRAFLNVAKTSYTLNGLPIEKSDFRSADFFAETARMRRADRRFDCVILDPPFFSETPAGRVDLMGEAARLINKARPLVADGGCLVAVNNALFLSGADYIEALEQLCSDGYMQIEQQIAVPEDCTGSPQSIVRALPADPAPFNHATKIVVLRLRRK
jgi:23S rRNA (cytosine1962-C5)-methyltransferase